MVEDSLKKRLEILTQSVAVAALLVYSSGFVVLTVYHYKFGISQLDLLRPKILAAGVLVSIFIGIPIIETLRMPVAKEFFAAPPHTEKWWPSAVKLIQWLLIMMTISAVFLRQVFVGSYYSPETHIIWGLLGCVPLTAIVVAKDVWKISKYWAVPGTLVAIGFLVFCLHRTNDKTLWVLIWWFMWCAFITTQAYEPLTSPQKLLTVNVMQTFVCTVATFGIFGLWVYGRIPGMLMGGEPMSASISFKVQDKPPLESNQTFKVWIIDESPEGVYFLQTKEATKAVFVPRDSIGAIYFGDSDVPVSVPSAGPNRQPVNSFSHW